MSTELDALKEAISKAGSQSALARIIGGKVKQGHVWYWLKAGRLPAEHAPIVAEKTGVPIGRLCPEMAGFVRKARTHAQAR